MGWAIMGGAIFSARGKKKGMRRAYLKKFSSELVNGGHSPANTKLMSEFHGKVASALAPWLNQVIPAEKMISGRRQGVLLKIRELTLDTPDPMFIVLKNSARMSLTLFWSNPHYNHLSGKSLDSQYFFVLHEKQEGILKTSLNYGERPRAFAAYKHDRIRYVRTESVPPITLLQQLEPSDPT